LQPRSSLPIRRFIRIAPRLLVAVLVFMVAGIFTASLLRHWLGLPA
jgi:peptidoglycan/LPS O-acetylase OafA/YrhL